MVEAKRIQPQRRDVTQPIQTGVDGTAGQVKALRDPLHGCSRILVQRLEDSPIGRVNSGHTEQSM
jgi:hypothetical protein